MSGTEPLILSLDTATTGCSAAVVKGEAVLASHMAEMQRGQAEALLPIVGEVLSAAGITPDQLDAVAVTRGPGAFTGLRIGLAAARAFAMAIDKPCIGVTTFEAVAWAATEADPSEADLLVCIESKRDDVYVQRFYNDGAPAFDPQAAEGSGLAVLAGGNVRLAGDAAGRAQAMLAVQGIALEIAAAPALPDPVVIARIAAARLHEAGPPPEPLYLRPPDAQPAAS